MSAYYGGPACWLLSDHYKAAYNHVFLAPTVEHLQPDILAAARVRARSLIAAARLDGNLTPQMENCFLAHALADLEIFPRLRRPDGSFFVAYWYRVKNVPTACAAITADDLAKAIGWLTHMCDGRR